MHFAIEHDIWLYPFAGGPFFAFISLIYLATFVSKCCETTFGNNDSTRYKERIYHFEECYCVRHKCMHVHVCVCVCGCSMEAMTIITIIAAHTLRFYSRPYICPFYSRPDRNSLNKWSFHKLPTVIRICACGMCAKWVPIQLTFGSKIKLLT